MRKRTISSGVSSSSSFANESARSRNPRVESTSCQNRSMFISRLRAICYKLRPSPWIGDPMRRLIPFLFLAAGIMVVGCEDKPSTPDNKGGSKTSVADAKTPPSKHAGWWCTEHGIPEEECLMCLHSEDDLKKKGDWCDKHDYCKSQCFACDPKLKERYAAKYKAKFGKE